MASAAPSDGGDDKAPEIAPVNHSSLDPPADPQRNGESPELVPSEGDDDVSEMEMFEIPDPALERCGEKRPLPSRSAPCRACTRRKVILGGVDPGLLSDELAALPSAPPPSPVPGTGMELPDAGDLETKGSPSATATAKCSRCEFRKKIHLNRRLRRNINVPTPPPASFMPTIPSLDDNWPLALGQKVQAARERHGEKRPLSVEQERGYRECDVGKKLMRHKWDGLRHKWAALPGMMLELERPFSGAAATVHDLLEMPSFGADPLEMPGFGAAAGGLDLPGMPGGLPGMPGFVPSYSAPEILKLAMQAVLQPRTSAAATVDVYDEAAQMTKVLAKWAKKPSSTAARVDVLQEKLAQITKVLTKRLHEGRVLQASTKLMRLLCPDVSSSVAAGGGLDDGDWGMVEETIDNLVNHTGEGMQDIAKTVIPKVFSKEILFDLILACLGRYAEFLGDDKGKLTKEKFEQYTKQLLLMGDLSMVYNKEPENFSKIMKLMCNIGRCGPLPSEVIDDISPGLDPTTLEQLYTGMLERLNNVDSAPPVHTNPSSK